jgi:hypothetical protein
MLPLFELLYFTHVCTKNAPPLRFSSPLTTTDDVDAGYRAARLS